MAEHNYTLTIQLSSDGSAQSPIAGQSNQSQKGGSDSGFTAKKAVKALVSFNNFVKPFAQPIADGYIQTISLRTGAQEAQERIQFAYQIGEQAVGIGTSIITGLIVGNLPGALIGAGVGILTTALNYANKAERVGLERSLESISLRGMNVRAGGYAPSYAGSRSNTQ